MPSFRAEYRHTSQHLESEPVGKGLMAIPAHRSPAGKSAGSPGSDRCEFGARNG